jgi:peptide/nickel transport system ATP-binding protein
VTGLLDIAGLTLAVGEQRIVDDLSLTISQGEIVGVVGESGSGKSQMALAIAGLTPPAICRIGGHITLDGRALDDPAASASVRGREVAYIFQEPMTALNPAITIGHQMRDVIRRARDVSAREADAIAREMLTALALRNPDHTWRAWPHQLSGGMRQRILIALAFACRPRLIVADEPTTALDVLVQAQVLALLLSLARDYGCGVLFISHDLAVVRQLCSRACVMRHGVIVEEGATEQLLSRPHEPYTRELIASCAEGAGA